MLIFLAVIQLFPPLRLSGSVGAAQRLSSCFAFHAGHIALLPLDKQKHTSADAVSTSGSLKTQLTTPPNGCSDDNSAALKEGDCRSLATTARVNARVRRCQPGFRKYLSGSTTSLAFFFFELSCQRREVEVGRTVHVLVVPGSCTQGVLDKMGFLLLTSEK